MTQLQMFDVYKTVTTTVRWEVVAPDEDAALTKVKGGDCGIWATATVVVMWEPDVETEWEVVEQ